MPLTPLQQHIARTAFAKAAFPEDMKWSAGGLLAQIALLTGTTHAELERWDAVANGDGPLTLDRLQESGNAFAGWPLDALEALDRAPQAWRAFWSASANRTRHRRREMGRCHHPHTMVRSVGAR